MRDERPLGTAEEVADFLGVPVKTLYAWRQRETGPASYRVGKHLRYRWHDVEAWLATRVKEPAA